MEWYFRKEVDDVAVPKNYEQSEMASSPGSWSPWGITAFGSSDFPKESFNAWRKITHEELTFGNSFYSSTDMENSSDERQNSNNSSMSQGLYNNGGSLLWNDQTDYQQFTGEQARIDHMDDLLFSSLLEDDPTKYPTESPNTTIPANNVNIFDGEILDPHNIPRHGHNMGSSKCLKKPAFSPSLEWEHGEVPSTFQMLERYMSDQNSMEESVLQELEGVTVQFTETTRICFRDALYRLAETSKQTAYSCHNEEPMLTSNDDTLGARRTEVSESRTNAIDRAIANLMFTKICFEDKNPDEQ